MTTDSGSLVEGDEEVDGYAIAAARSSEPGGDGAAGEVEIVAASNGAGGTVALDAPAGAGRSS